MLANPEPNTMPMPIPVHMPCTRKRCHHREQILVMSMETTRIMQPPNSTARKGRKSSSKPAAKAVVKRLNICMDPMIAIVDGASLGRRAEA